MRLPLAGYEDDFGYVEDDSDSSSSEEEGSDLDDRSSLSSSGEEESGDESAVEMSNRGSGRKRRASRNSSHRVTKRISYRVEVNDAKRSAVEYYRNSYRGESSALLAHILAGDINKSTPETLWAAILGVTDQFVLQRVTKDKYVSQVETLQSELTRFFPIADAHGTGGSHDFSEETFIRSSEELRLDMLRHWTLFSSLTSSAYVCTKLMSWRKSGRNRILELLAKLGIPTADARQLWRFMKEDSKKALNKLPSIVDEFGLFDLHYDGFVRNFRDYKGSASAADVVLAANAVLELGDVFDSGRHTDLEENVKDRFWKAYDIVCLRQYTALQVGLKLAIRSQELLVSEAHQVLERKKIIPSGSFRYVLLRDSQQKKVLIHPLILSRLALFLQDALRCSGVPPKPFVILAPDETLRRWVIVGVTGRGQKNNFGHRFRAAAEKIEAILSYNGFDSSVVTIKFGQETEFVRHLHDVLSDG